ncbi:MAG: hypothetical protein ACOX9R_19485 [Armatimonadota bacterium]|jgi:hypothetical protein
MIAAGPEAAARGEEIDLSGATVIHDRGDWGYHIEAQTDPSAKPAAILDGDDETAWSAGHLFDLAELPTNLLLTLAEPVAIGAMEITTSVDSGQRIRLTDVEVYARAGDGWALLADVKGNEETVISRDLPPAEVALLRVRVMGNQRPDNKWAVIRSLRLFGPEPGAELVDMRPGEVAGESLSERIFVREALGLREPEPRVSYDPGIGYLGYVTAFMDTMIEHGTDRYGEVHSPQFVSMLELQSHQHPGAWLPAIPGQRIWDRAMWGNNLAHDLELLETMEAVSEITGDGKYRDAARAALEFFLSNCTDTPTGLWPWGEHAYWNFYTESYDAHLTLNHETFGTSTSFWEMAWEINPAAVRGQADGLLNHVKDLNTFAFCRHADITKVLPDPRPEELLNSLLDFQSVGGNLIHLWAFVWSKTGDAKYHDWIERMTDYFETCRLQESGMLPVLSQHAYRPSLQPSPGSTLNVGMLMLQASALMEGTDLGARLETFGTELIEVVAADYSTEPPPPGLRVVRRDLASGGRTMSFWEDHGGWLDLRFDLPRAGEYQLRLHYALSHDSTRRVVLVNGEEVGEFELPGTGDWDTFVEATVAPGPLTLPAGEVVVRLLNRDSVGLSLDWMALQGVDGGPEVRVEGEDFLATGGVGEQQPAGLTVGFDSAYGGAGILRRQITDREIVGYMSNGVEMRAYRATGDERHLQAARRVAEAYARITEVPEYDHLRAGVFGGLVHMMLNMNEFDPDPRWLAAAERFAQAGIEGLYGNGLFRGATGQWYYDSHLGVSSLVSGLVRLHQATQQ